MRLTDSNPQQDLGCCLTCLICHMFSFLTPDKTNSLLVCLRPRHESALLIIGSNRLAASRIFTALEASFHVYVAFPAGVTADHEIVHRIADGQINYVELVDKDILEIMAQIPDLDIVCVTDSLLSSSNLLSRRSYDSCEMISKYCRERRIHVNIVDRTSLNDISFPATHRWRSADGLRANSLQIAVNTFGKGCRLATRIKRDIVAQLPVEVGRAVDNISLLRAKIMDLSSNQVQQASGTIALDDEDDQHNSDPINTPVAQLTAFIGPMHSAIEPSRTSENVEERRSRRMKWVAQVSEYWPIRTIGRIGANEMDRILADFDDSITPRIPTVASTPNISRVTSANDQSRLKIETEQEISQEQSAAILISKKDPRRASEHSDLNHGTPQTLHSLGISRPLLEQTPNPRVLLLGSGPGHPALLTLAAYNALRTADLVLADKLVPEPVLKLIPSSVLTVIAKKFPGNAENAQIELQEMALQFVLQRKAQGTGGTVVRLKQGDPYIYGRGGEEVLYFRSHGIETFVVPGISSSIAAPLMCNIPVTQRGVSDSLILCTGVGRAGKTSIMPGYRRARTLIVLMGVARIGELITALTSDQAVLGTRREADKYPGYLPIALIERGSSKDQRLLLSTLDGIEAAIIRVGDQRPPGMLVIGWCCLALEGEGNVDVTEPAGLNGGEAGDRARVHKVLGDCGHLVRDGVSADWMEFLNEMAPKSGHE